MVTEERFEFTATAKKRLIITLVVGLVLSVLGYFTLGSGGDHGCERRGPGNGGDVRQCLCRRHECDAGDDFWGQQIVGFCFARFDTCVLGGLKRLIRAGIAAAHKALKPGGTLAIWSAWGDRKFEQRELDAARQRIEDSFLDRG